MSLDRKIRRKKAKAESLLKSEDKKSQLKKAKKWLMQKRQQANTVFGLLHAFGHSTYPVDPLAGLDAYHKTIALRGTTISKPTASGLPL